MNQAAIYAGTFDPLTYGHLDVIERAARIFPRVVVGVAASQEKSPLFSLEERMDLVRAVTQELAGVEVAPFSGLLVDFAEQQEVEVIVRGLRAFSDFEFEFQMALTNRTMKPRIETLFLMPKQDYSYVSSSNVREVAKMGGDIRPFVPAPVQAALVKKYNEN